MEIELNPTCERLNMTGSKKKVETYLKKVCILGDPQVGKTSLIRRFVHREFEADYISTIGMEASTKTVDVQGDRSTLRINLVIWDIAGQDSFRNVHASYFSGAEGALLVCDRTRTSTVESLPHWVRRFRSEVGPRPMIVLLNKTDLSMDAGVESKVEDFARSREFEWLQSSALTGDNVDEAFQKLARKLITG